jgi:DNA-binding transcriptional LysR family regulator
MLNRLLSEGGISLDRLGSFHEVAESGSITAAANGSPSRQSLLSRQISDLESFFGVSLLRRESRPHRLTSEGEELARLCREFFVGIEECSTQWKTGETVVSIVSGESLLQWIVLPLVRSRPMFRKRTGDAVQSVIDGKADLALVRKDAVPDGLKHEGEFALRYRLIVPEAMAAKVNAKRGIEILAGLPLVLLEGDGDLSRAIKEECGIQNIRLDVRLECSSFPQIAEAIQTMDLAGFLPRFAPPIKRTVAYDIPEMNRLSRILTLAWSPRRERMKPSLLRVVEELV